MFSCIKKWQFTKDVEFKITNPGEQMTNTFHSIVLDDNTTWYTGKFYDSIKYKYKLTEEEYISIYYKQNEQCALCSKELELRTMNKRPTIQVDHDHKTGKVRGFLCMNCNVRLGWYLKRKEKIEDYVRTE